jgi:hypothetical protein
MGCQTAIAEKILARGGDCLLTLKGNQSLSSNYLTLTCVANLRSVTCAMEA